MRVLFGYEEMYLDSQGFMQTGKIKRLWLPLLSLILLLAAVAAPAAQASPLNEDLVNFGEYGTGAGQLRLAGGGIAADPESGHLFLSDAANHRISEFTAWGEFVKAWGWGVDTGAGGPQTCNAASGCVAGIGGSAAGQLNKPNG